MGASQSDAGQNEDDFEDVSLSLMETNAVKMIFSKQKLQDQKEELSQEDVIECLKQHLRDQLPSSFQAVVQHVKHLSDDVSKNKMTYEECVIKSIYKIISSSSSLNGLTSFLHGSLLHLNKTPTVDDLSALLLSLLQSFALHPSTSITQMQSSSCEHLISKFTKSWPEGPLVSEQIYEKLQSLPIFQQCLKVATQFIFLSKDPTLNKLPELELAVNMKSKNFQSQLSFTDMMFINFHLMEDLRVKWRLLYSSVIQGESFSKLSSSIIHQGPLLIVVKDQQGHVFGGFVSTNMEFSASYQGDESSFIFSLKPDMMVYNPTGYNEHYAYININQQTIPNGLGMGGQHNYFGFWISDDYGVGHSKAKPRNTTFASPMLSASEEFKLDSVEVWAVGDPPPKPEDDEDDEFKSIIDKDPEAAAILRVLGKERVSEGFRDEEESTSPGLMLDNSTMLNQSSSPN